MSGKATVAVKPQRAFPKYNFCGASHQNRFKYSERIKFTEFVTILEAPGAQRNSL